MNANLVKRNLSHYVYDLLKRETNPENKRLNAADIIRLMEEKYEVSLNRQTVYRCIDDLNGMGYSVLKDNKGYYMNERLLTDGEALLLVDGIESLKSITPDRKIEIYDKICGIIGEDPNELNNFLYDRETERTDDPLFFSIDNANKFLEGIACALRRNKQLLFADGFLTDPFFFSQILFVPLSDEEQELLKDQLFFNINPYQIFRDHEENLQLLFYVNVGGTFHAGVMNIGRLTNGALSVTEEDIEKTDVHALFRSFNLTDFESIKKLHKDNRLYTARMVGIRSRLAIGNIMSEYCESSEKIGMNEYGSDIYEVKYKESDHEKMVFECIENADTVKVFPGSALYFDVRRNQGKLDDTYDFDTDIYKITRDNPDGTPEMVVMITGAAHAYKEMEEIFAEDRSNFVSANMEAHPENYTFIRETDGGLTFDRGIDDNPTPPVSEPRSIRLFDSLDNELFEMSY